MPNGDYLRTKKKKQTCNLTTVPAIPSRGRSREGEPLFGLRTFYVASIGRRGSTLGETVIIMSKHFLQNSTDHFAVTRKRKKLHIHGNGCFPGQIWKEPKSSVEKKRGPNFPHATPKLGRRQLEYQHQDEGFPLHSSDIWNSVWYQNDSEASSASYEMA